MACILPSLWRAEGSKIMKTIRLKTPFEPTSTPLAEYPRPQFARDSYVTLNGEWNYAIYRKSEKFDGYQGKILVPFSPECLLSGLPDGVIVTPTDTLYYERTFNIDQGFLKARTFLNCDAVDYECKVIVNGKAVGEHKGGYTPFSIDITKAILCGENKIEVIVNDPTDTSFHARGKQSSKRGGIWYTPQSGIWQSIWLESVPETYLKDVTIVPDIDKSSVTLQLVKSTPSTADIVILDNNKTVVAVRSDSDEVEIKLDNFELWSPESPKLYDLAIKVGDDIVKSYFGMRKFSVVLDKNGIKRLALNNKPYFHTGVLDQGYWSDGMLTPPSNSALEYDVKLVKTLGFNMIRKHIKIEPMRWYYHCDKEGILVWQDMVSGGSKYKFSVIGALPFVGINLDDSNYKAFSRESAEGREEYYSDMQATVSRLKNCVSLAMWVPFNEGWGQFDSVKVTKALMELDSTRTIDSVSGWHDQGKTTSDFKSLHIYFKPVSLPKDKRCILLSEFGGYSLKTEDHVFSPDKSFGYKIFNSPQKLADAYEALYEKQVLPLVDKGLSATVYTQVSDVEEEINGLVTYDRKVVKFPVGRVRAIN
ncbi:MAG: glycoside hydrolase family 2 TIM barrel-domain containing protein, partial [Clostridia bacterium]